MVRKVLKGFQRRSRQPLVTKGRLKAAVRKVCRDWGIPRTRIPNGLTEHFEGEVERLFVIRVLEATENAVAAKAFERGACRADAGAGTSAEGGRCV